MESPEPPGARTAPMACPFFTDKERAWLRRESRFITGVTTVGCGVTLFACNNGLSSICNLLLVISFAIFVGFCSHLALMYGVRLIKYYLARRVGSSEPEKMDAVDLWL